MNAATFGARGLSHSGGAGSARGSLDEQSHVSFAGMQGFTRRAGQKLRIGEHIVVSVQRIRGGSVRLGFVVPPDVAVDREEIAEFKKRERVDANLRSVMERKSAEPMPAGPMTGPLAKVAAVAEPAAAYAAPDKPKSAHAPRKTARRSSADHAQRS